MWGTLDLLRQISEHVPVHGEEFLLVSEEFLMISQELLQINEEVLEVNMRLRAVV